MAEIAEVSDAQAVELEDEDRVRPAFGAGHLVVLGGDPEHLADCIGAVLAGGCAQRLRLAADHLDGVVIAMLVGDEEQVDAVGLDRRVVELEAPVSQQRSHLAEGVD